MDEYEKKLNKNLEMIKKEKVGKEISDERQVLLDKVKTLEKEKSQLEAELKKHDEFNPVEYEKMKKNIEVRKLILLLYFVLINTQIITVVSRVLKCKHLTFVQRFVVNTF